MPFWKYESIGKIYTTPSWIAVVSLFNTSQATQKGRKWLSDFLERANGFEIFNVILIAQCYKRGMVAISS